MTSITSSRQANIIRLKPIENDFYLEKVDLNTYGLQQHMFNTLNLSYASDLSSVLYVLHARKYDV